VSVSPSSWMDQFVLRGRGPAEVLTPFRQTMAAASMLARVAEDRSGLSIREYDAVGSARYQAMILAELAHQLEDEVSKLSTEAERSSSSGADPARTLISSLTGVVRTTATLVEVCYGLLRVADALLVVRRGKARVELAAAVETLRAAVGTSQITIQVNLTRITDARTYDQLAEGLPTFDLIREHADRIAAELREQTAPRSFPEQRADVLVWP
jgi:hypothetical protein